MSRFAVMAVAGMMQLPADSGCTDVESVLAEVDHR
jgi:hypothetical protein